jgi:hypothetical protein
MEIGIQPSFALPQVIFPGVYFSLFSLPSLPEASVNVTFQFFAGNVFLVDWEDGDTNDVQKRRDQLRPQGATGQHAVARAARQHFAALEDINLFTFQNMPPFGLTLGRSVRASHCPCCLP